MLKPLLLLIILGTACTPSPSPWPDPAGDQRVILISLDGFRPDYLERGVTPHLDALAARGVRARWMTPAFPTKTFPNHYTIVTGLYPEHHGIVANTMRDSVLGTFRMSDTIANRDARWWGGEPIWATAEKQGRRAAAFFWPGSESGSGGAYPSHWMRFDDDFPDRARVDSVLTWASLPVGTAPVVTTLYYSDVDHAGHDFGPDAPQVDSAVARVDSMIGHLVTGIAARGLGERVNILVVSDHGMAATPSTRLILLDDHISLADVDVVDWTPVGAIVPKPGKDAEVHARLRRASPHLQVFRKAEVPARFRFNSNPRITPLVLIADEGWSIISRARAGSWRGGGGHGWDHEAPSMRALFIAAGPAFREGAVVEPFQNVHVYELMARILGLTPAPNDGNLDSVRVMLR